MAFFSVATCPGCRTRFRVVWRVDESKLRPSSVLRITCPGCWHHFDQITANLTMLSDGQDGFPTGMPVRHLKLVYDCPNCGKPNVSVWPTYTDLPDRVLLQRMDLVKCDNQSCSCSKRPQRAQVSRIVAAAAGVHWGEAFFALGCRAPRKRSLFKTTKQNSQTAHRSA